MNEQRIKSVHFSIPLSVEILLNFVWCRHRVLDIVLIGLQTRSFEQLFRIGWERFVHDHQEAIQLLKTCKRIYYQLYPKYKCRKSYSFNVIRKYLESASTFHLGSHSFNHRVVLYQRSIYYLRPCTSITPSLNSVCIMLGLMLLELHH